MDIPTSLAAIRAAIDAGRVALDAKNAITDAAARLRIADLMGALSDARIAIADLQEEVRDRERQIADLTRRLIEEAGTSWEPPFYWRTVNGEREGPFCQRCKDGDGKWCRLVDTSRGRFHCQVCGRAYDGPDRARFQADEDRAVRGPGWVG